MARVEQVDHRKRLVHAHQGLLLGLRLAQHQREMNRAQRRSR